MLAWRRNDFTVIEEYNLYQEMLLKIDSYDLKIEELEAEYEKEIEVIGRAKMMFKLIGDPNSRELSKFRKRSNEIVDEIRLIRADKDKLFHAMDRMKKSCRRISA